MEIMNIEEIVASLRQTESRSKRKLLDEAADAIEELAKTSIVKRIPCEVDPRKEYVELDGIRLVREEGQIVGWYRPGDGLVIDANAPTVDAVPVVRCRDCKHWGDEDGKLQDSDGVLFARCKVHNYLIDGRHTGWCPTENDFCSYGERKEGADNDH